MQTTISNNAPRSSVPRAARRTWRAALTAASCLTLLAGAAPALADEPRPGKEDDGYGIKVPKPAAATLNVFGCEGLDGAPFAGRYANIDVFADVARLAHGKPRVDAMVFGKLYPGLFPSLLSGALVTWQLTLDDDGESWLLYGVAVRPDGAELLARLWVPTEAGEYEVELRTDNLASGEESFETIVCAVR